jgi:hypothetical protein
MVCRKINENHATILFLCRSENRRYLILAREHDRRRRGGVDPQALRLRREQVESHQRSQCERGYSEAPPEGGLKK